MSAHRGIAEVMWCSPSARLEFANTDPNVKIDVVALSCGRTNSLYTADHVTLLR
jgi:hypothetical protein